MEEGLDTYAHMEIFLNLFESDFHTDKQIYMYALRAYTDME